MAKQSVKERAKYRRPFIEGSTYYCKCNCGEEIKVTRTSNLYGMADFISGHNTRGTKASGETKKKQAQSRERWWSTHPEEREKLSKRGKGIPLTSSTRKKLSEAKLGKPSYRRTEEHKNEMSKIKKKNNPWANGDIFLQEKLAKEASLRMINKMQETPEAVFVYKYCKRGYFSSSKSTGKLYYSSSYEKRAYELLEQNSAVKNYKRCDFSISYKFNNKEKNYLPDILVTYTNGSKDIIEIKPNYLLKDEKNIAKFKAGNKYCKDNNLKFNVWTEHKLF